MDGADVRSKLGLRVDRRGEARLEKDFTGRLVRHVEFYGFFDLVQAEPLLHDS